MSVNGECPSSANAQMGQQFMSVGLETKSKSHFCIFTSFKFQLTGFDGGRRGRDSATSTEEKKQDVSREPASLSSLPPTLWGHGLSAVGERWRHYFLFSSFKIYINDLFSEPFSCTLQTNYQLLRIFNVLFTECSQVTGPVISTQ